MHITYFNGNIGRSIKATVDISFFYNSSNSSSANILLLEGDFNNDKRNGIWKCTYNFTYNIHDDEWKDGEMVR